LQNCLSSPNVSIGDMVFQAVRTRFPLRIAAGMTELGLLQEPQRCRVLSYGVDYLIDEA
jgi:hypothetical protein